MIFELEKIESVFGKNANLYTDVLQIEQTTDTNKLQQRYLERWHEIKRQTKTATTAKEQSLMNMKVDALHNTFKVLMSSSLRTEYDKMLQDKRKLPVHRKNILSKLVADNGLDTFVNICCFPRIKSFPNNEVKVKNREKSPKSVVENNFIKNENPCNLYLGESLIESFEVALEDFSQDESFLSESDATYDDLDNTLEMEIETSILSCGPVNGEIEVQTEVNGVSTKMKGTQIENSQYESFSSESYATYDDLDNTLDMMESETNILSCVPVNSITAVETVARNISDEIKWTQIDTASAIYQITSVFSIRPDELDGMFDTIDKAKELILDIENYHEMLDQNLLNRNRAKMQEQGEEALSKKVENILKFWKT